MSEKNQKDMHAENNETKCTHLQGLFKVNTSRQSLKYSHWNDALIGRKHIITQNEHNACKHIQ